MTFHYDLSSATESIVLISTVRLEIGDTVENDGVRPDRSNFSDEEIQVWLDQENDDPMLAAARACDALARAWSLVTNETVGPRKTELGQIAERFEKQANGLRSQNSRPSVYLI